MGSQLALVTVHEGRRLVAGRQSNQPPAQAEPPLAPSSKEPARVPWLKVTQAAEYVGLSRDTIYTACERGELQHVRVGGRRTIRLRTEWLDNWLERHTRGKELLAPAPRRTGAAA